MDRWEKIKEVGEKWLENLQEELQKLKKVQHALSGMTLAQLLKTFPAEKVLSEEVRNNDLLVFLLRRGYLDEKYANYINYFKGTSITKEDMNFILSVKNQTPLAFEYSLTKTAQVVERLQPYEFEQKAICNFDLLEELLANGPSEKLTPFLAQLADGSERSWKFLEECVDRTAWQERLIGLLAKEWNGMWARIAGDDTLTYERQLMYLRAILNTSDAETLKAQNQDNCLADYLEQHEDILQKLAPCDTAKIISAISSLHICFEALQTAGVPKEVLDCVVEGCHYAINEAMIRTVVSYKNVELAGMFETQPYTTILCLGYDPMTEYIHSRIALYVRNVVLAQAELSDRAEDVVDMLIRLKGDSELRLQVIRQEKFRLNCIEDCAGELARQEGKVWQPVWDALLEKNAISENWENVVSYWGAYQFSEGLKQYLEQHADGLAGMDTAIVPDEFIRKFILEEIHSAAKEKLLPVLRMEKFDLDILAIDEATLGILVDCRYFDFTADFYLKLIKVSQEMGLKFILKNQDSYMELRKNIPMTNDLFENLMLSRDLLQKYRDELFSEYAKDRMTEKVALQMKGLQLPVTKVILNVAWNRVELKDRISLLSEHCGILDAAELLQKFREIGGSYAQLADRTRRHEVTLPSTPQNRRLAEYMQEIGYITSYEEVKEKGKIREPLLNQKKNHQLLKLRVRPVKA